MSFDLQPIPCDEVKWQRVRAKFAADGVEVPDSTSGTISYKGVMASFTFDGNYIRITVLDKPWVTEGFVETKLDEYIESA